MNGLLAMKIFRKFIVIVVSIHFRYLIDIANIAVYKM